MYKKLSLLLILFFIPSIIMAFVVITGNIKPYSITNLLAKSNQYEYSISEGEKEILNNIYNVHLELLRGNHGNTNIYLPKIDVTTEEEAIDIGVLFDIDNYIDSTEEFFLFEKNQEKLYVYKTLNLIRYESSKTTNEFKKEISSKEALEIAERFYEDNLLINNYEEAIVQYKNDAYSVSFISRLNNIKKFAFMNNIILDKHGSVISMEYYTNKYEKLNSFSIKSMKQAYYELPIEFQEDIKIDIYDCELVYIYENSIVQPAYFFKGKIKDGRSFECFVKATIYK